MRFIVCRTSKVTFLAELFQFCAPFFGEEEKRAVESTSKKMKGDLTLEIAFTYYIRAYAGITHELSRHTSAQTDAADSTSRAQCSSRRACGSYPPE
jgi:hypothetical protein